MGVGPSTDGRTSAEINQRLDTMTGMQHVCWQAAYDSTTRGPASTSDRVGEGVEAGMCIYTGHNNYYAAGAEAGMEANGVKMPSRK